MKKTHAFLASLIAVLFLAAGCGKKNDSSSASSGSDQAATSGSASGGSAAATGAKEAPASGRAIEVTANDQMKFSVTEIRAKPGEQLSVTLKNVGTTPKFSMGHNWCLFKSADLVQPFLNEVPTAAATDYIPASRTSDLIAHTKLLGPKEQDTVSFQAPKTPGRYPFICSFPGHYQVGMKGELIVE